MADKKKKKQKKAFIRTLNKDHKSLAKKGEGAMGTYDEDTGGGEPMGQGDKYPEGGRGVWKDTYQQEPERESSQPRTEDGKFTYNAVNGKPLKDISKKNGKSRGTTIPPTLTGGKNGVKEDDEEYRTQYYRKGDVVIYKGRKMIALEDYVEGMKEYTGKEIDRKALGIDETIRSDENKEKLRKALAKALDDKSFAAGDLDNAELFRTKRGRDTSVEQQARQKFESNKAKGKEAPVVGFNVEAPANIPTAAKTPKGETADVALGGAAGGSSKSGTGEAGGVEDIFSDSDIFFSAMGADLDTGLEAIKKMIPGLANESKDKLEEKLLSIAKKYKENLVKANPNQEISDGLFLGRFKEFLKRKAAQ